MESQECCWYCERYAGRIGSTCPVCKTPICETSSKPTLEPPKDDEWAAMLAAASKPVEDARKPRPLVWTEDDTLPF